MIIQKIVNFFGDSKYKKLRWRLLLATLLIIVIADFFVERHHDHFWEEIPGWGAFFGFVSCFAIIFVSKFIGKKGGIMKDEDYYD